MSERTIKENSTSYVYSALIDVFTKTTKVEEEEIIRTGHFSEFETFKETVEI